MEAAGAQRLRQITRPFIELERDLAQNRYPLLRIALAHDPAKCKRFADEIMRQFIQLERDLAQNRYPLLRIAL
jgi:hypothetical protein